MPGEWSELETPCLLLERRVLERNLQRVQARVRAQGAALRPHIKTHKSRDIARLQQAAGAVGITAAKPSEALVFIEGGFGSVTLAAPVVDPRKLDRLLKAALAGGSELGFISDSDHCTGGLAAAARRQGVELPVFLKIDVGLGRVGVEPDSPAAVEQAQAIASAPGLRLAGLLSHAGHAYAAGGPDGVRAVAGEERLRSPASRTGSCRWACRSRRSRPAAPRPCCSTTAARAWSPSSGRATTPFSTSPPCGSGRRGSGISPSVCW